MRITICGPVSLHLLKDLVNDAADLPKGFEFPWFAYLVNTLVKQGHHVTYVTSTTDVTETRVWQGSSLSLYVTPSRRRYMFCIDGYRKEINSMIQAIRESAPDIVHAQWTYAFARAGILSGFPCLVTAHDEPYAILKTMRTPFRLYHLIYAKTMVFPRVKYLSFVSPYLKNKYEHFHHCPQHTYNVPNGLQADQYASTPKIQSINKPIIFGTISAAGHLKNPETALAAFKLACNVLPNCKMLFIGHGLGKDCKLEQLAKQQGLAEKAIFLGGLEHSKVLNILRNDIDVFVNTSREESFCLAILEAMGCGVPVIGGKNSGAIPWLLDNGKAGILVDCEDSVKISEAMVYLATHTVIANSLAAAGWQRAKNLFTLEYVAEQYVNIYKQIISDKATNH